MRGKSNLGYPNPEKIVDSYKESKQKIFSPLDTGEL
jgi:hypothetical protein